MPESRSSTSDAAPLVADGLGATLRARRAAAGLSARALAEAAGVSPSLISQIERDRVSPSVATLYAIARAMDVSLDELLGGQRAPEPVGASVVGPLAPPAAARRPRGGPVLRAADRPSLSLATGVSWERLTADEDAELEFIEMVYEVGGSSCREDTLMRHRGREYLVVVEGRLAVALDDEVHELGAGDALVFDADRPHRLWALGRTRARVITAVVGRSER